MTRVLGKDSLTLEAAVTLGGLTIPLILCSRTARHWFQASYSIGSIQVKRNLRNL